MGREDSGRSHGTWNKDELLGKISTIWVIFPISLQWLQGDDFVNGQRNRNGEQGESTTCILAWLEHLCWTHVGGQTQGHHSLGCRQLECRCDENIEQRMTTGMLICPLGSCPLFMVMCSYELNVCSPSPTPSLIHHPSHPKNSYLEASNPRVMGVGVSLGGN